MINPFILRFTNENSFSTSKNRKFIIFPLVYPSCYPITFPHPPILPFTNWPSLNFLQSKLRITLITFTRIKILSKRIFQPPLINSIANLHNYYFHSSRRESEKKKETQQFDNRNPTSPRFPSLPPYPRDVR